MLSAYKIWGIQFKGKIVKFSVEWRKVGKMCLFNRKLAMSQKRWEMGPRLLLITNRKWCTPFRMTWKSRILDKLEGHWQPVESTILATAGLLVLEFPHCINAVQFYLLFGVVLCCNFRRQLTSWSWTLSQVNGEYWRQWSKNECWTEWNN